LFSSIKVLSNQKITDLIRPRFKELFLSSLGGVLSTLIITLFPGLGLSQAATLGSRIVPRTSEYTYLIFVGGIRTADVLISLITWYTISKTRNGSIVSIEQIIDRITLDKLLFFVALLLFVVSFVSWITIFLSKLFSKTINTINYNILRIIVVCIISLLTLIFSGFYGILVLVVSTLIGLLPILSKTSRSNSMGVLLVPTIIFYLSTLSS